MKKAFALSTLLATASAGLGAYAWNEIEDRIDEANCAANKWECSTHISRTISDRKFRYGDEEGEKMAAIMGQETYDNLNGCDRAIAGHMELDVARIRVIAEFTYQLEGNSLSSYTIEWTPPSTDRLFESFKDYADNKRGFHCGAIDAKYFADGQDYDDTILQYVESTSQSLDFYR